MGFMDGAMSKKRAACVGLGAMLLVLPDPARAATPSTSQVTGCSRHGHGCVTAAVRVARRGFEVRLPSGGWIACRGDCRDTLREETVDFWESHVNIEVE